MKVVLKIYVASSWDNRRYPSVIHRLRTCGHQVFDFRDPDGRGARRIEAEYIGTDQNRFLELDEAKKAFNTDFDAMENADVCILVLPSGRSSHLEAGWFIGRSKPCYILTDPERASRLELMYGMATMIESDIDRIIEALSEYAEESIRKLRFYRHTFPAAT